MQVPSGVSPFLVPEGQNVQMEMYFGRRREARDLVMSPRYSRLFSGRKLGKSALLKYVEATYDGERLPSGNVLRVVYVSAVGVDSEAGLVQKIVEGLRSTLRWTDASTATATAPEKPPLTVVVIGDVPEAPWATESEVGDAASVNVGVEPV
mgnify:CR=1 FL=1